MITSDTLMEIDRDSGCLSGYLAASVAARYLLSDFYHANEISGYLSSYLVATISGYPVDILISTVAACAVDASGNMPSVATQWMP